MQEVLFNKLVWAFKTKANKFKPKIIWPNFSNMMQKHGYL